MTSGITGSGMGQGAKKSCNYIIMANSAVLSRQGERNIVPEIAQIFLACERPCPKNNKIRILVVGESCRNQVYSN